jgi:hypothetical protein
MKIVAEGGNATKGALEPSANKVIGVLRKIYIRWAILRVI